MELPITKAPFNGLPNAPRPTLYCAPIPGGRGTVLHVEDNLSNVRLMEQIVGRRPEVTLLVAMQGRMGWRWGWRTGRP